MQIGECAIALELCRKNKNAVDSLSNSASSLRLQQPIVMPATGNRSCGTIWPVYASDKLSVNLAYQWWFDMLRV